MLLVLFLLLTLILFGAGFALHVLWWIALAALVIGVISHLGTRRGAR